MTRPMKLELALALGFSEVWVNKLVGVNKENGPLTTEKSLQILEKTTGLQRDDLIEDSAMVA